MRSSNLLRSMFCMLLVSTAVGAQAPTIAKLGPQIGDRFPPFSGVDQFGRVQTLDSVVGKDGAMVVVYRSADW